MMDLERIRNIAKRVTDSEGLELVAVEWAGTERRGVLRVFLGRPQSEGGITHADCQAVSEQLGVILDVEDLIPGSYVLEVASPGLDRKLYSPDDYARFRGRRVKVRLRQRSPEIGSKRFEACLGELADGMVDFVVGERAVRIPYDQIAAVNLVVEF